MKVNITKRRIWDIVLSIISLLIIIGFWTLEPRYEWGRNVYFKVVFTIFYLYIMMGYVFQIKLKFVKQKTGL